MKTRAQKVGDGWVLNGSKMWITNGSMADGGRGPVPDEDIRGFLVEKGMAGFEAKGMHGKHSLRASDTSELVFNDVRLGRRGPCPAPEVLRARAMCPTQARYGIAWGAVGAAMACHEGRSATARNGSSSPSRSRASSWSSKSWSRCWRITLGQLLAYRLGRLKDAGKYKHQGHSPSATT